MDERVVLFAIIGLILGGILGVGLGAAVEQFTDAPAMFIGACIVGALGGVIGWIWGAQGSRGI